MDFWFDKEVNKETKIAGVTQHIAFVSISQFIFCTAFNYVICHRYLSTKPNMQYSKTTGSGQVSVMMVMRNNDNDVTC